MDAAAAAAMSDPERNPNFRRRWHEFGADSPASAASASDTSIGTLGLALQEALKRRRLAEQGHVGATSNGDPPR